MTKKHDKELTYIFLEYKKSLINNDTEFSQRIENILGCIGEKYSKILYGKYVQNLSMTRIAITLNHDRSYLYVLLGKAQEAFLQLYE